MYEDFFGLKTLPFKITPDPAFIYWDAAHKRAASILAFGIEQLVPITVVTGEVGTGKTTLLQHFLEDAPRETTVGMISNFWSGMGGLYQWILNAFDIRAEGSPVQLYRAFEDFVIAEYAAGRRCVLIVDEAQNVSDEDLEQLRMLTNINARKDCLLMLFLVGQPELRDRLQQSNNRQIAQRVGATFHLGPMSEEATGHYIRHRIAVAGGSREIFDQEAIDRVYRVSTGVPRLVNVVCELALVTAFGEGVDHIDGAFMDDFLAEAEETGLIAHLPYSPAPSRDSPGPRPPTAAQPGGPSLRKSAGIGGGKPSIRLVTDPWQGENTEPIKENPRPSVARVAEPPKTRPETDKPVPQPEEPEAEILSSHEALELLVPEPEDDAPENDTDTPDSEAKPQAGSAPDPDAPPRQSDRPRARPERGRLAWLLAGGLIIALTAALIAAVIVIVSRSGNDTDMAPTGALPTMGQASPAPSAQPGNPLTAQVVDSQPVEIAMPGAGAPPIAPLDDPSAEVLLERALTIGVTDPVAAAIAYARAALRGEKRAAYYLGQQFETGVGVARDKAAARAWYDLAQDSVRSARYRLAGLAPDTQTAPLKPPVPLLGGPLPDGAAEFVWTSGQGADPEFYLVETAMTPGTASRRIGPLQLTALSVSEAAADRVWRVLAIRAGESGYAVSDWHAMGAGQGGPVMASTPVQPQILVRSASGADVDAAIATLTAAGLPAMFDPRAIATEQTGAICFAYHADREAAERVAALLGREDDVTQVAAGSSVGDLILPGQLTVVLD